MPVEIHIEHIVGQFKLLSQERVSNFLTFFELFGFIWYYIIKYASNTRKMSNMICVIFSFLPGSMTHCMNFLHLFSFEKCRQVESIFASSL